MPQRGQCQREEFSDRNWWAVTSSGVDLLEARSCRPKAKREARKRLARKPKCRMRTKLLGSTCRKKRRKNSVAPRKKMLGLGDRWLPRPRVLHPHPVVRFAASHPR